MPGDSRPAASDPRRRQRGCVEDSSAAGKKRPSPVRTARTHKAAHREGPDPRPPSVHDASDPEHWRDATLPMAGAVLGGPADRENTREWSPDGVASSRGAKTISSEASSRRSSRRSSRSRRSRRSSRRSSRRTSDARPGSRASGTGRSGGSGRHSRHSEGSRKSKASRRSSAKSSVRRDAARAVDAQFEEKRRQNEPQADQKSEKEEEKVIGVQSGRGRPPTLAGAESQTRAVTPPVAVHSSCKTPAHRVLEPSDSGGEEPEAKRPTPEHRVMDLDGTPDALVPPSRETAGSAEVQMAMLEAVNKLGGTVEGLAGKVDTLTYTMQEKVDRIQDDVRGLHKRVEQLERAAKGAPSPSPSPARHRAVATAVKSLPVAEPVHALADHASGQAAGTLQPSEPSSSLPGWEAVLWVGGFGGFVARETVQTALEKAVARLGGAEHCEGYQDAWPQGQTYSQGGYIKFDHQQAMWRAMRVLKRCMASLQTDLRLPRLYVTKSSPPEARSRARRLALVGEFLGQELGYTVITERPGTFFKEGVMDPFAFLTPHGKIRASQTWRGHIKPKNRKMSEGELFRKAEEIFSEE